ncbi:ATP synthase F0 subcomplex B subunit [Ekhidna lutea]|uniref:ATP synthase subunit b n=1 Tax=Ekhidna lutea TaxID=447679 RepID=A0A239FBD4_EKHLU|nr:F0F1 ATP synthase subunit B [Ekhidna lutea]SNS54127.1 ATP synthase F0 subcomplex B subunit [Ekhidna lutea]
MALVTPDIGLIIWQLIVFLIVLFILRAFVWRPILSALKTREFQIEDSLRAAEHAQEEMKQIKADNEYLLQEARIERDAILKEARDEASHIIERAKAETSDITSKMIQDAREAIEVEKKAALSEVKALVASLSLEIAEKVLREKLSDDKSQKALVEKFIKDVKVN